VAKSRGSANILHIACLSIGKDRDIEVTIWDMVGLKNPENKCMVEVDIENNIKIHNDMRDMGRNIVEKGSIPVVFGRDKDH
jgi:hypothetical protein